MPMECTKLGGKPLLVLEMVLNTLKQLGACQSHSPFFSSQCWGVKPRDLSNILDSYATNLLNMN